MLSQGSMFSWPPTLWWGISLISALRAVALLLCVFPERHNFTAAGKYSPIVAFSSRSLGFTLLILFKHIFVDCLS